MPYERGEGFLDALPDLVANAEERGQPIVYRPSGPPPDHVVRLMATLGVRIELPVTVVSAHEAVASSDCTQPLCVNEAEKGTDRCRTHTRAAELRANGSAERPPAFNGRLAWTKASIVAAIQRWAKEHDGQSPSSGAGPNSWVKAGEWWPNVNTVVYHFGTWREAIQAAGLVPVGDTLLARQSAARAERGKSSVRVPQAPETPPASPEALDASPSGLPVLSGESPGQLEGAEPGTRTEQLTDQQLAQIQADGAKVDAYLASLEVAKQEVVDGEIIPTDSFAGVAAELEAAYRDAERAQARLIAAGDAFRLVGLPLILAVEGEWGIPLTEEDE